MLLLLLIGMRATAESAVVDAAADAAADAASADPNNEQLEARSSSGDECSDVTTTAAALSPSSLSSKSSFTKASLLLLSNKLP